LLGGRLASLLGGDFELIAGFRESPAPEGLRHERIDLSSEGLAALLDRLRPDAIVHAAAIADPDRCEADPASARRANVEAALALGRWCNGSGAHLVFFSTDLVFPGDRPLSRENDPPGPILLYGRTKLEAETALLPRPGTTVVRCALVAGRGHGPRKTATEAIAAALREGRPMKLYTDQFRTPVDPQSVAEAVRQVLVRRTGGLFHLGGPDRVSRFDLGRRVARAFSLPEDLLVPVSSAEYPPKAPRPLDVSLDSARAREVLSWRPRPLDTVILESRLG
jgi:dTDP-4-dehydrorhamnose reductase